MSETKAREFEVRERLQEERRNIESFEELVSFIENIKDNYGSDYGETPRAIAQAALATAFYLADKEFGITGFQANFVMWDFLFDWQYPSNECGLKIVNYDDMLYPSNEYKFEKVISKETFVKLQEKAKDNIANKNLSHVHGKVLKHWQSIVDGNAPFGYVVKES